MLQLTGLPFWQWPCPSKLSSTVVNAAPEIGPANEEAGTITSAAAVTRSATSALRRWARQRTTLCKDWAVRMFCLLLPPPALVTGTRRTGGCRRRAGNQSVELPANRRNRPLGPLRVDSRQRNIVMRSCNDQQLSDEKSAKSAAVRRARLRLGLL